MLNFPLPYSEELLYSTIARVGVYQGIVSQKLLLEEVFGSRLVTATLDLPNHISDVARWLPDKFTPERLVYKHTLFPIYAPFVPEERHKLCLDKMLGRSSGSIQYLLGASSSRVKTPDFIRYCSTCFLEQRESHGEYFWLRAWQVAGVEACSIHNKALVSTALRRPAEERHRFIAASPEVCPITLQSEADIRALWICKQVNILLNLPESSSPTLAQWTYYYQDLAHRKGYARGTKQVDYDAVRKRVKNVWSNPWLERYQLKFTESDNAGLDWINAFFRKRERSFNYLQHLVILHALIDDEWQIDEVIKTVKTYPEDYKVVRSEVRLIEEAELTQDQKEWLSLLEKVSVTRATRLSPALQARLYKYHHAWLLSVNKQHAVSSRRKRGAQIDWEKRDDLYFQQLYQFNKLLQLDLSKPRGRRSKRYFSLELGIPATALKNLSKMPLTQGFLLENTETVEQHQIRRLKVAHEKDGSSSRYKLLKETAISEASLTKKARLYLESELKK